MQVNSAASKNKVDNPSIKPSPSPAKAGVENFSELLKNAQAAAGTAPAEPAAPRQKGVPA